jgi:hypothetical protein
MNERMTNPGEITIHTTVVIKCITVAGISESTPCEEDWRKEKS